MRVLFYSEILTPDPDTFRKKFKYYRLHIGNGVILYFSSERKARNEIAKINRELAEILQELAEMDVILYRYFRFSELKSIGACKNITDLLVNVQFSFSHLDNDFMKQVYLYKNLYNLSGYLFKISQILLQETKNVQIVWINKRLAFVFELLKNYRRGSAFDLFNRGGE